MGFWSKNKGNIHRALHNIYDEEEMLKRNEEEAEEIEALLDELNDHLTRKEYDHEKAELKEVVDNLLSQARKETSETKDLLDKAFEEIKRLEP